MKISMKRVAALVLALVMVFGLMPVMNNAANAVDVTGLTDGTIGVSYVNAGQPNANTSGWTASGNAITGNLQGVKKSVIYMAATSTLTITNNKSAAANLSFDYSFTTSAAGGTVTIDGTAVTGGSFTKKLGAGETVVIVLSVPRASGKDNAMSISITNLILASASNDPVTTTFEAPAFGSYTVAYSGESLTVAAGTASQTATNLPSVSYTLTANPGDGYKMVGWYNVTTDTYLGTELTYTGSFEEACTVKAVIVPEDSTVFKVGESNYFSDLNEAVAYAQANSKDQITLVQSGTLAAGDYTVPAGITLLIPMDTLYTPTRTDDEDFGVAPEYTTDYTTPYAYVTMSMADGAKLTVNGTLDIESKHTTYQGGKATGGRPCGAYGAIYMNPEASITVGNGGNLYAWGYIYGEGNVTANSGAKVYEIMQVTDFPGGSNMSQFVDTDPTFDVDGDGNPSNDYFKTFPFSQYYVQNIEVALTLKSGAAEYVYITMTAGGQSMGLPVRFIGEGGMFVPGEGGTIVKDYDPSTDRLNVTVNGDAQMAGIALDLSGTKYEGAVADVLGTSKVDSASFILTLNGNITINIASGTTTVKQDLSLLPGVEINIAKDATLVVAERSYADGEYDNLTFDGTYTGYNIYVWDLDNWGNFVFKNKPLSTLTYSPTTGRYVRTADDLKDVRIDINGTVICEGYIYSTVNFDDEAWVPVPGAGAAVISTGKTGTLVLQNGPGPEDMAYCLDGYSDKDSAVFVDSVWLLNGDGTYVLTEGCEPGTTYNYCDVHDLWYTEGHDNCVVIYTHEVTWIVNGVGAPEEYTEGETPFYKGATPTKPADGCTVYTFAGWATSADGQVLAELPAVTGDAVYFAVFTESVSHSGGTAYCNELKICAACGERYGSLDPNNHKEVGYYENEADNKHHIYYSCCGTYGASEPCSDVTGDGDHGCDKCVNNGITDCVSNAAHDCQDGVCVECGTDMPAVAGHEFEYECDKNCRICGDEVWPDNDHCQMNGCDTQCYYCGEEIWPDAQCVSDAEYDCQDGNCIYCGEPVPASENHDWLDATCTEAATCGNCGATTGSALGHGYSEGWDYVQIDNDVHQVWCKDCYGYNYDDGHDYVNHVCSECGWTERMSVKFYNGDTLWRETITEYGCALGIGGMEVPAAPTGYRFAGWYTADGIHVAHGMTITEDVVAYATWAKQTFTITWIVDGVSTEEVYVYGATPSFKGSTDKASDGCTTYTFDGWDKDIVAVTGDVTYTAEYTTGISHTGELEYTHVDEWSHKVTWSCCGAVVSEEAVHEDGDDDGYCDCGGVFIKIMVNEATIYGEEMENGWQYIFIKPGSTYTTDVGPATGWGKVTVQIYDAGNDTSVINRNATQLVLGPEYTSAFNEDLTIFVYSYAEIIIDLNGGDVIDEFKEILNKYDPENGIAAFDLPTGSFTEFDMLKDAFVREGYTLVGITDGQTTYTGDENITSDGEDLHLTLIWKADHVCSENLTEVEAVEPDCDTNGVKAYWSCSCGKYYADANASTEIPDLAAWKNGDGKIEKLGHGHTEGFDYTDLKNGNHSVTCKDCGTVTIESEGHDYTYDKRYHKCQCGAVEEFKLTVVYGVNGEYTFEAMLPYWTRMDSLDVINNIPWFVYVNDATHMGYFYLDDFYWDMDGDGDLDRDRYFTEGYMTDEDMYVEARYDFNGFVHDGNGWKYRDYGRFYKNEMVMLTKADVYENGSDEELEGIYMVGADGYRIENGMGRWYYLGYNPFSGITYEPNAEDIAYYESKGQTFIDKEMTWYYFGADGKMAENYTGLVGDSYVINGQAAWHIGLVEIDGEYYYFKGDEVNGGNKMVSGGDFYLNRNNSDFNMVVGGIYTFDNDGKLQWKFHGIVESDLFEGKRHYIGGRLTPGLGLMDLTTVSTGEVRYFYVDSYGNLILDAEYYIGANSFGLAKGIYYFDAEGFLVIPEEEPGKSGLFFEEGKWYYYVDGAKAYCAGLIEIDGNWVYVKSDGSLATGVYYVTNTNGHETIASGTKCTFNDNGVLIDPVIGVQILEEGGIRDDFKVQTEVTLKANGKLTIDVSNIFMSGEEDVAANVDIYGNDGSYYNELVRGEGVAEFDLSAGEYSVRIYIAFFRGAEDDDPGYGSGDLDYKITFTGDGTPLNGIVDGYYYVDGHIAYAAGLIEIDGYYYYVRSNGQIVTDCQYWITNVNDTGYEPGLYDFDCDGWMSEIYVETFTGIKDGYFYIDDEVAYAAGLVQYNGGYIYVRSNGQIATGKYWITNHNGLLPEGFYDFGEDGIYYPAIPENAHLLMEVDKNVDTDGFWDSNAIANAIRASADGNLYIEVTDVTFEYELDGQGGFCIEFEGSYWVMQWDDVYKVGTGTVMIPISAGENVIPFVNPADVCEDYVDSVYGTISYKVWSDVECELVQGGLGE